EIFARVERDAARTEPLNPGRVTLLHSGIVYPSERDPTALFQALAGLSRHGVLSGRTFRLRFRAPAHEDLLHSLAKATGTADLVEILPPVPYGEALAEMMRADGLVVMQAANCNEQIPAKFYEYLRARRPILGLADPQGDTGRAMRRAGVEHLAKLEDPEQVQQTLGRFVAALAEGRASPPNEEAVREASREARVRELVQILDTLVDGSRT
ncbi:MAG: glycosyltransferase, partial [Sutterellaceae bacterium]|nr:glycosyltransferase [Burkholderiaceae bacterium]MDW8429186.1 glycosyltransferase [Sutterellaceae bacterium]